MNDIAENARLLTESQPVRFTRGRRALAYVLSTKILVGGILGFVGTQAVEAVKIYRTESREDVKAVTEKVTNLVADLPLDSIGIAKIIVKVENLYISFTSPPAREYISGVIGQLANRKARALAEEKSLLEAQESARLLAEAKAKSEAAAKAAEEAKAAKAAEAARLEMDAKAKAEAFAAASVIAQQQAVAAAEARRQATIEAKAYFDQRKWDRMPK